MSYKFVCPHCGGKAVEAIEPVRRFCKVDFDETGWPNVGDEMDSECLGGLEWRCSTCFHEFDRGELQDIVTGNNDEK